MEDWRNRWANYRWEPEPIYYEILEAYFSNPSIQLRHVIQAPIKGFIGFLGTAFFGLVWEVKRGAAYNFNPSTVAIYNSLASDTNFVISVIKVKLNRNNLKSNGQIAVN